MSNFKQLEEVAKVARESANLYPQIFWAFAYVFETFHLFLKKSNAWNIVSVQTDCIY